MRSKSCAKSGCPTPVNQIREQVNIGGLGFDALLSESFPSL